MIRRLRGFAAPGSDEREPVDVNEAVREAARLALIGAADQQIATRFELAEGLPAVTADRVQVQQVVVNLIRNAIDAMLEPGAAAGGEPLLVVETGRDAEGAVTISVRDTGPGIAAEAAAELFTPFVTTKKGGMGIGLSVSRSIVEAHGGRIRAEPAEGGGARFVFTLPVVPADVAADE
jgi:two-component system sensor kinase FixL